MALENGSTQHPPSASPGESFHLSTATHGCLLNQLNRLFAAGKAEKMQEGARRLNGFLEKVREKGFEYAVVPFAQILANEASQRRVISEPALSTLPEFLAVGNLAIESDAAALPERRPVNPFGQARDLAIDSEAAISGIVGRSKPPLQVGSLAIESDAETADLRHNFNDPLKTTIPALVNFRESSGVFVSASSKETLEIASFQLQLLALRLLVCTDPRKTQFYLVDTTALGRNVRLLASLQASNATVVTTRDAVQAMIKELQARITQNFTQILRQFDWMFEYNEAFPESAREISVVVISNYKNDILTDIADHNYRDLIETFFRDQNAARAGVYFLVAGEYDSALEDGFARIGIGSKGQLELVQRDFLDTRDQGRFAGYQLVLESLTPLDASKLTELLSLRWAAQRTPPVRIEFPAKEAWTRSSSTHVRVPIGKEGGNLVELVLGDDGTGTPAYNALIGGAVGSGKTVLLHTIIAYAATLYSPEEIQFVLLDYKEGTEFRQYRTLAHVKALSIGSDVDFGVSVLRTLSEELRRRGEDFQKAGVSKIDDYRTKTGAKMPRILVIIDEFQVLLTDSSSRFVVPELLDDLVRRGRSFGIHFILSSQSLTNISIETSTLSQIPLRICLRLSPLDCRGFLGVDNDVPASFTRPGEALFNDREGINDANRRFRVAYVTPSEIAKQISELDDRARRTFGLSLPMPIIYDGESYASLDGLLGTVTEPSDCPYVIFGQPMEIGKPPVCHRLSRDPEQNLIIAGNFPDKLVTVATSLIHQLARQSATEVTLVTDNSNELAEVDVSRISYHEFETIMQGACNSLLDPNLRQPESTDPIRVFVLWDAAHARSLQPKGGIHPILTDDLRTLIVDGWRLGWQFMVFCRSASSFLDRILPGCDMYFSYRIALANTEVATLFSSVYNASPISAFTAFGHLNDGSEEPVRFRLAAPD